MKHDEEKIEEIVDKYWDVSDISCYDMRQSMREYGEHIRKQAIEECRKCVPEVMDGGDDICDYFNKCREQTLSAINHLIH